MAKIKCRVLKPLKIGSTLYTKGQTVEIPETSLVHYGKSIQIIQEVKENEQSKHNSK